MCSLFVALAARAQEPAAAPAAVPDSAQPAAAAAPGDPRAHVAAIHDELRALRDAVMKAWDAKDYDALLAHVDPNVVVTWQNAEVVRGHDGLRRFLKEMVTGGNPIVSDIKSKLDVDELSILLSDDTAIAFGTIHDTITLATTIARASFIESGSTLDLASRWTATLKKRDGVWKIAAYHVSADMFSNPVLGIAVGMAKRGAMLAGGAGLLLGVLATYLLTRRKRA
jgi:ketosteroid isomerase-like protein